MRNLTPLNSVELQPDLPLPVLPHDSPRNTLPTVPSNKLGSAQNKESTAGFSQRTRLQTMSENAKAALGFMDKQQKEIKELIKQFQMFSGYLVQIPECADELTSRHAWQVYLMHAQSLQTSMGATFSGKALFGDGAMPPVRLHLEMNGNVEPFDLPDPCLSYMPSIRSFLGGVSDHRLPSTDLVNACMAELLNALVDVQLGREKMCAVLKKLSSCKSLLSTPLPRLVGRAFSTSQNSTLLDRLRLSFRSFSRVIKPSLSFS